METRANYVAVGIFTIIAIVTGFVLIFWFGRLGDDADRVPLIVRVQGSVSGLGPGSAINFNGINVGRVVRLNLDPDPRFVRVETMVNQATPIREDTKASIGIRGLSGGAFIALEGGSPKAPPIKLADVEMSDAPVIQGDPAALSDLVQRVNELANRTEEVMDTVETFVKTNSETVTNTLTNAETFSKALADNSDGVDDFLKNASGVAKSLGDLSSKLDNSISRAESILNAVEPGTVRETVDNVREFTQNLASQRDAISSAITSLQQAAGQVQNFASQANTSLTKVDDLITSNGEAISRTVSNAENFSKSLSDNSGSIDAIVKDAQAFTKSLGGVTERLEKSLDSADAILAAVDREKITQTVDDVAETASKAKGLVAEIDPEMIEGLVGNLSKASENVTTLLSALDAQKINNAVESVSSAAKGAEKVVSDVSAVSEKFGGRAGDVDKIFDDAVELAERLNETSKRIDGVVAKVDGILGSGETDGLMSQARETLETFQGTARNFDRRVNEVSQEITTFADRGLRNTQGLINDARQSIQRIDRVIRQLENNPSSLITGAGGSKIRETGAGRPRR